MKPALKLLIAFLLLLSSSSLNAQYYAENHSYQINGNNLHLYLESQFPFGTGICDFFDTCSVELLNDTIFANVIYDIRGIHFDHYCTDYDTVEYSISDGFYTLVINNITIDYDSAYNLDTVLQTTVTFQNLAVSLQSLSINDQLSIYPNPAKEFFDIRATNEVRIKCIELFDIRGNSVKTFDRKTRRIDIHDIGSGTYILKISIDDRFITKMIVVE